MSNDNDYGLNCESELDDLETTETIIEIEENSETEAESETSEEAEDSSTSDDVFNLTAEIFGWYV